MDIAGVVDEVGEGAGDLLSVGNPAMAIVVPNGTHGADAEYVVVPKGSAVALPDGADAIAAATLPIHGSRRGDATLPQRVCRATLIVSTPGCTPR